MPQVSARLVTDPLTRHLVYDESQCRQETRLEWLTGLVMAIATWPLWVFVGAGVFAFNLWQYGSSILLQKRITHILTRDDLLTRYAQDKIAETCKRIEHEKAVAEMSMDRLNNRGAIPLPIPPRESLISELRKFWQRPIEDRWSVWRDPGLTGPWQQFIDCRFDEIKDLDKFDQSTVRTLQIHQLAMKCLQAQSAVVEADLKVMKAISQMDLLQAIFKRQSSKEWLVRSLYFLLPCGVLWAFSRPNHRAVYAGKREFLPSGDEWKDQDLVEAHNRLVRENPFLVPYLQ